MNELYIFLSVLVFLQFSIKIGLSKHSIYIWLWGLIMGLSAWIILPFAWNTNILELNHKLREGIWADNFVLLVSLDVLIGIATILRQFKNQPAGVRKFEWLVYIPSILIFPSVYWLGSQFFFIFPELSYLSSVWLLSISLVVLMPLLSIFFRWILFERTAYLEFGVVLNLLLFLLILILPIVNAPDTSYREPVNWKALAALSAVAVAGFLLGLVFKLFFKKINLS